jgi:hypothetical protein
VLASSFLTPHMTVGDLVVGIGTLALASFTYWLGRQTRRTAKAAEDSIKLEREALQATRTAADAAMIEAEALTVPFVVLIPVPAPSEPIRRVRTGGGGGAHKVKGRLHNIGAGAAIVTGVSMMGPSNTELLDSGQRQKPLAPQGFDDVELLTTSTWEQPNVQLTVLIRYFAPDGRRYRTVTVASLEGSMGDEVVCRSFARQRDEPQP